MDSDEDAIEALLSFGDCQDSSSEFHSSSDPDTDSYLVGYITANGLAIRHHAHTISGHEIVRLLLDPKNVNAIKIFNRRSTLVGYIEESVASVLSPLLRTHKVKLDGSLHIPSKKIKIHVFATLQDLEMVKSVIKLDDRLLFSEAVIVQETNNKDEIFKKDEIFNTLEPPQEMITTRLFLHQKEGLWWLMQRENSDELPFFWEEEKDGFFKNVWAKYRVNQRPDPLRGGIFADEMGLGKTLTLLSLIALDKDDSRNVIDRTTCAEPRRKKQKSIDDDGSCDLLVSKTTLIVCPPAVLSTWMSELEEHVKPGSFKTCSYDNESTKDAEELRNHDIVLTTYSTLASEESLEDSPIKMIEWWRVILDEAHNIKNVNAQQSRAVTNLKAERRWVVTGTPIQNGSSDLFSFMVFLRFEPFEAQNYWKILVQRPLAREDTKAVSRLQVLMDTISLRRIKDKVKVPGLPSKTVKTYFIKLSGEERKLYDQMESEAKGVMEALIRAGSLDRNYSTVLCVNLRLRQICNDINLCPSDLRNLLPSNEIEEVSNNPELLQKVVAVLQDGEDFDCPICKSTPTDTVITQCGHIFCRACILKSMKVLKPCCPLCRRSLSKSDLFSAPPESSQSDDKEAFSSRNKSSKVAQLLKLLTDARDKNPNAKSVIFSQFQKMLILLEEPLKAAGFKILRLDGSINVKKRGEVIKEFSAAALDGPTLLLASLKASGAGINLAMASTVYLMEPWWNPAVEEQAINQVHRIGQKKDVTVVRLIVQNSIEEKVLEMQERKKKLAMEAFGQDGAKAGKVSVADLRTLVSM
ncbi:DNA/RNA helicase protein [Euphorbia peplus]|nr:DNA/RNA helicase protein [Euphorbia peplus]